MKYVGAIRRELGIRTVFNILGPLTNPASPAFFLLGVYDGYLVEPLAKVLASLGVKRGFCVYGEGTARMRSPPPPPLPYVRSGTATTVPSRSARRISVLPAAAKEDLAGGTPAENAAITRADPCTAPKKGRSAAAYS
jgi:anthranilate phosphoribosyltransferase